MIQRSQCESDALSALRIIGICPRITGREGCAFTPIGHPSRLFKFYIFGFDCEDIFSSEPGSHSLSLSAHNASIEAYNYRPVSERSAKL